MKINIFSPPPVSYLYMFYLPMHLLLAMNTESDDWTYKDTSCGLSWGKNAKLGARPGTLKSNFMLYL